MMIIQTSGSSLRRYGAGRLAGALGLLLALALLAGGMLPAYAQGIPPMPHGFAGTVSTLTPPQLVPEGTLVQAFMGGVKKAETTVDANGEYTLLIRGTSADAGKTVTFRVAGVTAGETSKWESGKLETLDLTISALPGAGYALTMTVAPAGTGNATDLTNAAPYGPGIEVDIRAVAAAGYAFINWTASPAVIFADSGAAQTAFTMPEADVTVTANFGQAYALTIVADPEEGGQAVDVLGKGAYAAGATVSIEAQAATGYRFVGWTAAPAVVFGDAGAAETTFIMISSPVTITANFELSGHTLTLAASPVVGGIVSAFPVQDLYQAGASVQIQAVPASGYQFSHWTAGGGTLGNPNVALTTFTMPAGDVTVFATFTLSQTGGAICFIATAAYGSSSAEQIDVLREFRDAVLLKSTPGLRFVALYYRLSPPVAEVISANSFLRTMVRELLIDPLVWMVEAAGDIWRD